MTQVLGIIVTGVSLTWAILVTVLFFRSLNSALSHADRIHERMTAQQNGILDRLMAEDFQSFKSYQLTENAPSGGYVEPDVVEYREVALPIDGVANANR